MSWRLMELALLAKGLTASERDFRQDRKPRQRRDRLMLAGSEVASRGDWRVSPVDHYLQTEA